jgi:hypothetical protein
MKGAARTPILAALLLGAVVPSREAAAQDRRWEVSPEAGYLFGGTLLSERDFLGRKITGTLENAGVYGVRAAFLASPSLILEIQAARTDARFDLKTGVSEDISSFRTDILIGSAGYRFAVAGSFPYVSLGAGAARLDAGLGHRETRFTAAAGAGVEKFLVPSVGFRLDGRLFVTRLGGSSLGIPCSVPESADGSLPARPCRRRDWLANSDVTAGLVFAF